MTGPSDSRMAAMDQLLHRARSLGGSLSFFGDGWGRFRHNAWLNEVRGGRFQPSPPLALRMRAEAPSTAAPSHSSRVSEPSSFISKLRRHGVQAGLMALGGAPLFGASFESPGAHYLPSEAALGHAWIVPPRQEDQTGLPQLDIDLGSSKRCPSPDVDLPPREPRAVYKCLENSSGSSDRPQGDLRHHFATQSHDPSAHASEPVLPVGPTSAIPTSSALCDDLQSLVARHIPQTTPVVVQLAATGDHGPWMRYMALAQWLSRQGIASVILESPFYNTRRPEKQGGARLRCVSDLADLGRATIEEACGVLSLWWSLGHRRLAVTGISQGGLHAAMAASLCPFPVATVSVLAPPSAAPVFTNGCLSSAVDWSALEHSSTPHSGESFPRRQLSSPREEAFLHRLGAQDPHLSDLHATDDGWATHPHVRTRLYEALDAFSNVINFPEPDHAARHILLAANADGYVRPECVNLWLAARPGIELRWLGGGHVSAILLALGEVRRAVLDAVAAPYPQRTRWS